MIFGNKNEVIETLKAENEELSKQLTYLEKEKIIANRKVDEVKLAYSERMDEMSKDHIFEVREYQNEIESIKNRSDINQAASDAKHEQDLIKSRTTVRAEFKNRIEDTKKENKNLVKELAEVKGKYEGLLIANKGLNAHIDNLNATVKSVLAKLPDVSAKLSTSETSVTVNK